MRSEGLCLPNVLSNISLHPGESLNQIQFFFFFCAVVCNTSKHDDRPHNVTLPMSDLTVKTPFLPFEEQYNSYRESHGKRTQNQLGKIQYNYMLN